MISQPLGTFARTSDSECPRYAFAPIPRTQTSDSEFVRGRGASPWKPVNHWEQFIRTSFKVKSRKNVYDSIGNRKAENPQPIGIRGIAGFCFVQTCRARENPDSYGNNAHLFFRLYWRYPPLLWAFDGLCCFVQTCRGRVIAPCGMTQYHYPLVM